MMSYAFPMDRTATPGTYTIRTCLMPCRASFWHYRAIQHRGEAFNILGPEATSRAFAVKYIAKKTGQKYFEANLDTVWDFECSIDKARRMLGYEPKFTTKRLIDGALAWREKSVFTKHKLNSAEFWLSKTDRRG